MKKYYFLFACALFFLDQYAMNTRFISIHQDRQQNSFPLASSHWQQRSRLFNQRMGTPTSSAEIRQQSLASKLACLKKGTIYLDEERIKHHLATLPAPLHEAVQDHLIGVQQVRLAHRYIQKREWEQQSWLYAVGIGNIGIAAALMSPLPSIKRFHCAKLGATCIALGLAKRGLDKTSWYQNHILRPWYHRQDIQADQETITINDNEKEIVEYYSILDTQGQDISALI